MPEITVSTSVALGGNSDLMRLMQGRARAALILIFAFPNVLPAPPGLSALLGLPHLYLTSQMVGNIAPAFAICLIALGGLERDGLWTGLGVVAGLATLMLSTTEVYAMVKAGRSRLSIWKDG